MSVKTGSAHEPEEKLLNGEDAIQDATRLRETLLYAEAEVVDQIEQLFQEWHRLGGAVLLAEVDPSVAARSPEKVIAESTAHCRESGRLTWIVLDWLIHHVEQLNEDALLQETRASGDLSVLGVLCDAARQRKPHVKFDRIVAACPPHEQVEPFFYRVARNSLALRLTKEHPLELFRRWNYLCSELNYLG